MNAPRLTLDRQDQHAVAGQYRPPLPAIGGALGDRRSWNLPEKPGAAPTAEQLLGWAGHLIANGSYGLGSTVVGRMQLDTAPTIEIPASALTEIDRRPAVWVVDPSSLTVSLRNVDILRQNPATVAISDGLDSGDIVVTAGVQALHPGQKTRLLGSPR